MRFPWSNRDKRQDAASTAYTDARLAALLAAAQGDGADVQALAAAEIASGLWGRAFASASVRPASRVTGAVTPAVLETVGRELVRRGEALFQLQVNRGQLALRPAAFWDVRGDTDPASWLYQLTVAGPDQTKTVRVMADSVVHARYAVAPNEPWRGISPLASSRVTANLAAYLEERLGQEAKAPVGNLIPVPDATDKNFQADINKLRGQTALVETTSSGWGLGSGGAPRYSDYSPKRIGAAPPETLPRLRSEAALHVLAACGVPIEILQSTDGTTRRESWRQFLHGTIQPVANLVSAELAIKLDTPGLSLSFDSLMASDLVGRARAFQSMVGGGMDTDKAAALSGLLSREEGEAA